MAWIFCSQCGTKNEGTAQKCTQCGEELPRVAPEDQKIRVEVSNYLVQAILVTIFCCWPCGIPAIVFAAQVNSNLGAGDIGGAMEASKKAKMWCWIAFGGGLAAMLIIIIFYALVFLATMSQNQGF